VVERFWQKKDVAWNLGKRGHEWVQKHLGSQENMYRAYAGNYFLEGAEPDESTIENSYHDWLSFIQPRGAANNPKFRVTTRKGGARARFEAKGYEVALNQIARDMRMRSFLGRYPLVDMQFNFGLTMATRMPDRRRQASYDFADELVRPALYRIAPDWYIEDPSCYDREGIRFYGWRPYEDKEVLLAMAETDDTWDKAAIEAMATQGIDSADQSRQRGRPQTGEFIEEAPVMYLCVPESEEGVTLDGQPHPGPGNGFNGTIYTYDWHTGAQLREPIAWFGAPGGPITMYGVYTVPNDPIPAGPLVLMQGNIANLNKIARASVEATLAYKRLLMADSRDKRLVDAIKNAPHDYVVGIRNFDRSKALPLEMGGLSPAMTEGYAMLKAQRDRGMAMHDTQRGIAPGGTTATAVNEAGESSDVRLEGVLGPLYEGVEQDARKLLHNLVFDRNIVVPVSHEVMQEQQMEMLPVFDPETGDYIVDPQTGEPLMAPADEVIFRGGDSYLTFEDLDVELVKESMPRSVEGLEQNMKLAAMDRVQGWLPFLREFPEAKGREILDMLADAFNDPAISDLIDLDMTQTRPPASSTRTIPSGRSPASAGGSRPQGGSRPYPATGGSGYQSGSAASGAMQGSVPR